MSDNAKTVEALRQYYQSGKTKPYEFRKKALEDLKAAIIANEDKIYGALYADLGKSSYESYMTEVGLVLEQITLFLKHLKKWMEPQHVVVGFEQFPGTGRILAQPYGVVLIMAPWNYPFQLAMEPFVGAIAAGNTVLVQPSDYSHNTTHCINDILSGIYEPEYVSCILGGHHENPDLLSYHYDYIFFTGSTRIGEVVQIAASKHTTPVTLELGGMSPTIVDETADIKTAGKRIMFGKVLNSGQTCVAPDYVYAHKSIKDELVKSMIAALKEFYPDGALNSSLYPHMINEKAYNRVAGLMKGATVAFGGQLKPEKLQIEPTILTDVTWDSPAMSEEIFGPLMPVMEYENLDDVINTIKTKPRPLACYVFTKHADSITAKRIEEELEYGGGCINDTAMHVAEGNMPFGGVGASGMGMYHGKYSFDTFTHYKSVIDKGTWADISARYLPYKEKDMKILKTFLH